MGLLEVLGLRKGWENIEVTKEEYIVKEMDFVGVVGAHGSSEEELEDCFRRRAYENYKNVTHVFYSGALPSTGRLPMRGREKYIAQGRAYKP